jgi:lipoprotein-anchoring transpeptidase ErfK/SrfK
MSRFTVASSGKPIGFHGIPLEPNGQPIQTDAELGQYRSHGCVRMKQDQAVALYNWAPIGTTVVVLP